MAARLKQVIIRHGGDDDDDGVDADVDDDDLSDGDDVDDHVDDIAADSDGCPSQIGNQQKTKTLVQKDEEKGVCRFTKTKTKTNTNTKTKTNTDQTDCRKPTLLCRMTRMKKEDFQN